MANIENNSRSGGFYQRWMLLNAGIALVMAFSFLYQPETPDSISRLFPGPETAWHGWRPVILLVLLVIFPLNGIYLVGSLHCRITHAWSEHRFFWGVLLLLAVAWAFVFPRQLMFAL